MLPEGRDSDGKDLEPKIEVLAKAANLRKKSGRVVVSGMKMNSFH
jgi:hypothetical protein